mmetsp:Transcript_37280/g.98875  ORF Transcript_37280/g.98875 Transcript_37280/m.98875 type:complete len:382 (-) Transcript_37280:210-1355(-)
MLLAKFREDRFGIPLIAAMSAFSPSISLSSKMRVPAKSSLSIDGAPGSSSSRPSSRAPVGPSPVPERFSVPLISFLRSISTGTPQTSPEPAHATAASSNSRGGFPSAGRMQPRRAARPNWRQTSSSSSSSSSSKSSSSSSVAACTSATSTTKPWPCSRARLGSTRPARAASHGLPPRARLSTSRSVMSLSSPGGCICPSRQHSRAHSTRRPSEPHERFTPLSSASVPTSTAPRASTSMSSCPCEGAASGVNIGSARATDRSSALRSLSAPSRPRSSSAFLPARRKARACCTGSRTDPGAMTAPGTRLAPGSARKLAPWTRRKSSATFASASAIDASCSGSQSTFSTRSSCAEMSFSGNSASMSSPPTSSMSSIQLLSKPER